MFCGFQMRVDAFLEGSWGPGEERGLEPSCKRVEPLPNPSGPRLLICTTQIPTAPLLARWEGMSESVYLQQCQAPKCSVSVSQSLRIGLLKSFTETNNAICSDMDGPRDCHTERSKSDRERQISYGIAYMWNLKKWYK